MTVFIPNSPLPTKLFNVWSGNHFLYKSHIFRPKLKTLGGKTYNGATFILPPFTMKDIDNGYKGFEVLLCSVHSHYLFG